LFNSIELAHFLLCRIVSVPNEPLAAQIAGSHAHANLPARLSLLNLAIVAGSITAYDGNTNQHPRATTHTMISDNWPPTSRGYFAVGAERTSKALNLGNLLRSAHGFGASFTFTLGATYQAAEARADTSKGREHVPHYDWDSHEAMRLPERCQLVGIELTADAIDLPSFRHPTRAAYVLGPERGSLSDPLLERCEFVVKIPTKFCVNVAIAGAIVMYDRATQMSRFADRPIRPGGPIEQNAPHEHGGRFQRITTSG
jgi:tRNA G18 (ribose-2'-O)-methylase SpoU